MLRRSFRAILAVFACAVVVVLASPGDASAQRSALYYPQSYGRTYGYYVAPSPVYVRPWGYTTYGPRVVPSYSVPVDVLPGYRGTYFSTPYYRGPAPYYHW